MLLRSASLRSVEKKHTMNMLLCVALIRQPLELPSTLQHFGAVDRLCLTASTSESKFYGLTGCSSIARCVQICALGVAMP